eukprot:5887248-Pyramimonas_sp.AAC.1
MNDEDAARRVLAAKDKVLERHPNLELIPGTPFTKQSRYNLPVNSCKTYFIFSQQPHHAI